MVTPEQISEYIDGVPAMPRTIRRVLEALEAGELSDAARAASADPALIEYLKQVVNSAAYGFRNELKEAGQIFSALGVERAKQLLYAYMVSLLAPKRWGYFALTAEEFRDFQAGMMGRWERIVRDLDAKEKWFGAAAILGAGLVVADAIFAARASEVALIRESGDLDLDTILTRVSGHSFESIVDAVAGKWEVEEEVRELVAFAFGRRECDEKPPKFCEAARMLHLLLFYELSRPLMMEAGANAFVSFRPDFARPVLEKFRETVEIA